ncbi:hypothetical protein PUN28_006957 [Cardiocondyla obscurior]|uniref:Uncharacterized protein n=1 Tax=Cardiocondyla obscurior TaxID=286306 RepID=A0AAW2G5X4_9HYME
MIMRNPRETYRLAEACLTFGAFVSGPNTRALTLADKSFRSRQLIVTPNDPFNSYRNDKKSALQSVNEVDMGGISDLAT